MAAYLAAPKVFLPPEYTDLDDTKPGWLAFKSATIEIQEFCDRNDLDLLFVMVPTLIPKGKNYLYNEVRMETARFLASRNITVIDLFDVFANYNPSKLWISPENTHWNGLATSLAAEEVANHIRKNRLIEKAR